VAPAASPTSLGKRQRDVLLTILGLTTGAVDATAFERLGHVFASVITGNLILLGVSAEQANGQLALFGGCSLASYAVGVMLASPRGGRLPTEQQDESLWPRGTTAALFFDLSLLLAFAVVWESAGDRPEEAIRLLMLALAAGAMGAQSSAVRRLGNFSTTYLTSTLTGVLEELVAHRWSAATARSLAVIAAVLAGAATATLFVSQARAALPLLPVLPLVVVIVTAERRFKT
jgi:uncharacterized membrane protein YoaK (UPF0700 family)